MPVSIEKSIVVKRPEATRTTTGSSPRPTVVVVARETRYRAGARRIRYRPDTSVVARATTRPSRQNSSVTWPAGALQGCSATQTGLVGPRVTVPVSPLREPAADALATPTHAAIRR